jgi:spore germination protein GerM
MRGAVIGSVCLIAALVASCSPGGQDRPDAIADRDVPFQLLDTTSTTTIEPSASTASTLSLYFVLDDRLVSVSRQATDSPGADGLLRSLLDGPTGDEASFGVTTAIPSGTRVSGVDRSGGALVVELSSDLATTDNTSVLAVGQLVLTASGLPGVERVRFEIDGKPVQVPKGDGTLASGAVTPQDYQELL